jgi:uncharacterized protein (TIGR00725 family)
MVTGRQSAPGRAVLAVGVVGGGSCGPDDERVAEEVGRRLAGAGALVVTGGLGGVMAAASRGAQAAGGTTVGLLPGATRAEANEWVSVAVPTGLGELRNLLVVRAVDALVAVGGEYGTLSEIALALKDGLPVVGLGTWQLRRGHQESPDPGIRPARDPAEAVGLVLELARPGVVPVPSPRS